MRRAGVRRTAVAAALAVATICLSAPAASAAPPGHIFDACGVILTQPGVAKVDTARSNCNANGITINTSNLTLDLGGRVIQGDGTAQTHTGINVLGHPHNVVIKNGTITNFHIGIETTSPGVRITHMVIVGNDIPVGEDGLHMDHSVVARNNWGIGIGGDAHFSRNLVVANGHHAAESLGGSTVDHNKFLANANGYLGSPSDRLIGNLVTGGATGIQISGSNPPPYGIVRQNSVYGTGTGISSTKTRVSGNHLIANDYGAIVSGAATVDHNVANGNTLYGLDMMFAGARILANHTNGNGVDGIVAISNKVTSGNIADGNENYGISSAAQKGRGTNRASDNLVSGQCDPANLCTPDHSQTGTPKLLDCSTGLLLDQAGTYRLQRSVDDCAANIAVHITHSNVTLDMAGRRIAGNPGGAFPLGISVDDDLHNVVVKNGTISGYFLGVSGGAGSTFDHMVLLENYAGAGLSNGAVLEHSKVIQNTVGVSMNGHSKVLHGLIAGNTGDGISVSGDLNSVASSTIAGNTSFGIESQNDTNTFARNVIVGNTDDGINATASNTINRNRIVANGGDGIDADGSNTIGHNRIIGNSGNGIVLTGISSVITNNVANGNTLDGASIASVNRVIHDVFTGNLDDGLHAIEEDVIKFDVANGNGDGGIITSLGAGVGSGHNHAKLNGGAVQCDPPEICS